MLASRVLSKQTLDALAVVPRLDSYEYAGCGHFATLRHPGIQTERVVCDEPRVVGESCGIRSGFIVFLENNELTLECDSWGKDDVPESYRYEDVRISQET